MFRTKEILYVLLTALSSLIGFISLATSVKLAGAIFCCMGLLLIYFKDKKNNDLLIKFNTAKLKYPDKVAFVGDIPQWAVWIYYNFEASEIKRLGKMKLLNISAFYESIKILERDIELNNRLNQAV